jgi:pimeloyl-ACP methyl ester carboxylesterase
VNFLKLILCFISLAFSVETFAYNQGLQFHKASLRQKMLGTKSLTMQTATFDQKLDHNNPADTRTFKQRYFIDSQYAQDASSPVFYIICGEWNCAGTTSYGFAVNVAKKVKAHLIALEHRYYGESLPMTDLTTANLSYLNLEYAIEDLASVQRHLTQTMSLTGKWIAFGGSYAGTLAAFYRLQHPELVSGSLASSAPVRMKPEFFEYDAHVAKVINKTSCGDKVREAVALIENKMMTPVGSAEVKAIFKASNIRLDLDFIYVVADILAAAVQYGRHTGFCQALINGQDPIKDYAVAGLQVLTSLGSTPLEISMQTAEKVETTPDDMFRQWMWQSCTQFGWFQVANGNGKDTSRSSLVDLEYHKQVCSRLYQTPMTADGSMNQEWFQPLFDSTTSKIIFSNGADDPWLTLSVTEGMTESNENLPLEMMTGAAHCSDLKATTQIPAVLAAQATMTTLIEDWIK